MYGSLPDAIFTLFAAISNGLNWTSAVTPLFKLHWFYPAAITFYITLVLYGVSNVVLSVFVDSAIMTSQYYKELIMDERAHLRDVALRHINDCFGQMDADGSGEISAAEMEQLLYSDRLAGYLDALGISTEDVGVLFYLLDTDKSGMVDSKEFAEGCLRLQGDAKGVDVHRLIYA